MFFVSASFCTAGGIFTQMPWVSKVRGGRSRSMMLSLRLPWVVQFLVPDDLFGDLEPAQGNRGAAHLLFVVDFQDFRVLSGPHPRVIINLGPGHLNGLCGDVQALHHVGLALVKIDGAGVGLLERAERVDVAPVLAGPGGHDGVALPGTPQIHVAMGDSFDGKKAARRRGFSPAPPFLPARTRSF